MKVSEIEELVQQITDRICQQLPKPTPCSCFFAREKRDSCRIIYPVSHCSVENR